MRVGNGALAAARNGGLAQEFEPEEVAQSLRGGTCRAAGSNTAESKTRTHIPGTDCTATVVAYHSFCCAFEPTGVVSSPPPPPSVCVSAPFPLLSLSLSPSQCQCPCPSPSALCFCLSLSSLLVYSLALPLTLPLCVSISISPCSEPRMLPQNTQHSSSALQNQRQQTTPSRSKRSRKVKSHRCCQATPAQLHAPLYALAAAFLPRSHARFTRPTSGPDRSRQRLLHTHVLGPIHVSPCSHRSYLAPPSACPTPRGAGSQPEAA